MLFNYYKDCDIVDVAHFPKMQLALGYLVLLLSVIHLTSSETFPTSVQALWSNFPFKLAASDCTITDYKKVFPKCDALFGNLVIADFIKASADTIVSLFTTNDKVATYKTIDLFCNASATYEKCLSATNKLCKNNTMWKKYYKVAKRDHPVYRVNNDLCKNGKLANKYVTQKAKVDTTSCLKNTMPLLTSKMENAKNMVKKTQSLFTRDPEKADSAKDVQKLSVLCSVSQNLKRSLTTVTLSCSQETQILFLKLTQWMIPTEINGKCTMLNDDPKALSKPYARNNKNRVTVFVFGGFHKYRDGQTTLETCQYNDNENITLIELDKFSMVCTTGLLNKNYSYIKSCSATFYDNTRKVIDYLNYFSNGVMAKTFVLSGKTSVNVKATKAKAKPKSDITLNVLKPNISRIIDKSTGLSVSILLFTSKQKVNVYSVVIRLTQSAYQAATGVFSRPCANSVTLGSKRGKRAATPSTTAQASADSTSLQDPKAATMSTNAVQETNSIVSTDPIFKGANIVPRYPILMIMLPILLMILIH